MIPSRYYLTVLSGVPILAAQVFLARRARMKAAAHPNLLRLWRLAVLFVVALFVVSAFGEFQSAFRLPRALVIPTETIVGMYGLISAAEVAIFLAIEFVAKRLPISFRQDRRRALRAIAGAGLSVPVAAAGFGTFIERTNFEVCETAVAVRNLPRDCDVPQKMLEDSVFAPLRIHPELGSPNVGDRKSH